MKIGFLKEWNVYKQANIRNLSSGTVSVEFRTYFVSGNTILFPLSWDTENNITLMNLHQLNSILNSGLILYAYDCNLRGSFDIFTTNLEVLVLRVRSKTHNRSANWVYHNIQFVYTLRFRWSSVFVLSVRRSLVQVPFHITQVRYLFIISITTWKSSSQNENWFRNSNWYKKRSGVLSARLDQPHFDSPGNIIISLPKFILTLLFYAYDV